MKTMGVGVAACVSRAVEVVDVLPLGAEVLIVSVMETAEFASGSVAFAEIPAVVTVGNVVVAFVCVEAVVVDDDAVAVGKTGLAD